MNHLFRQPKQLRQLIPSQKLRNFSVKLARMSDKSTLDTNKGSVGSAFREDGSIGQVGEKIGGPFDSKGAVGKEFAAQGSMGGTAQSAAEQMQGDKKSIFDKDGAIGKACTADGAIGSVGETIGCPFASDGAIGKQSPNREL